MFDAVEQIRRECHEAIRSRCAINASASPEQMAQVKGLHSRLSRSKRGYLKRVKALRNAVLAGHKSRIDGARRKLKPSFDARLMAATRATARRKCPLSGDDLEKLANTITLDKVFGETVIVHAVPSKPGQYRPVAKSGNIRRAQQLLLRDITLIVIGDSDCDSTVAGNGGERQTFTDLRTHVGNGYLYWVSIDVKNFFPSLRTGHLKGFPFSQWVLEHIVFLPKETPIIFVDKKHGIKLNDGAILKGEADLPEGYPLSMGDILSLLKKVRLGLLQGDACTPQIARTFLGREVQRVLENRDTVFGSHLDDLILGARSQSALKASLKALRCRLMQHPAGPLELHDHQIVHIDDGVEFIGYHATRCKDGRVHVRPSAKRFNRFIERLWERWGDSLAYTKHDLRKIGIVYAKRWFSSQGAWTHKGLATLPTPFESYSWEHVRSVVETELNRFIYAELQDGETWWDEGDVNYDYLGEANASV